MNKVCVIGIAATLLLTGCKGSSKNETESSSDTSTTVVTRGSAEEFEDNSKDNPTAENLSETSEKEYSGKSTATVVDFKSESKLVTASPDEKSQNQDQHNDSLDDDTAPEELPIMNDEVQKSESKAEIATDSWENSKIHKSTTASPIVTTTTVTKNNNVAASTSTTAVTKDDTIELPFVPVK